MDGKVLGEKGDLTDRSPFVRLIAEPNGINQSADYEDEQTQLKTEILTLQQEIEVQERQIENLEQFIQRVRKYEDLDELTPYALRELVKAIYIEAPDKSSGKRHQGIRISYDLVGFIPVEELLKQETA